MPGQAREDFVRLDMHELCAQYFAVAIPPPGWAPPVVQPEPPPQPEEEEISYVCTLRSKGGAVCGAKFPSRKQLIIHQRMTQGGDHGKLHYADVATVTNQCPWCRCVFHTRANARRHISLSLQNKVCRGKGSILTMAPNVPDDLVCKQCGHECDDLPSLLDHVTLHVPGPFVVTP